eukprot:Colp12_sorted_trinity150504_noHs@19412
MSQSVTFAPFEHLLKAPSKDFVVGLFQQAFRYKECLSIPAQAISETAQALQISESQTRELFDTITWTIDECVFEDLEPQQILGLFPADFHESLKKLIAVVLVNNVSTWKTALGKTSLSLPRLVNFDWRVDVKAASNVSTRMSVPTAILQLQVEDSALGESDLEMVGVKSVSFELNRETLDTMLDGLGKIQDQLASIAKNSE